MYGGMNRNETIGLAVLIVALALGVGVQAHLRNARGGSVWIERAGAPVAVLPGVEQTHGTGGLEKTPAAASNPHWRDGKLDLNAATAAEMAEALPMVGEVRAEAIVQHREKIGGFRDLSQLEDVPGIGTATRSRIEGTLFVDPPPATPAPDAAALASAAPSPPPPTSPGDGLVDINTADAETLATLENIGEVRAADIVAYRRAHGPFRRVEDLTNVPGVGEKTLERNRARLVAR